MSPGGRNYNIAKLNDPYRSQKLSAQEELDRNEYIGEKYNHIFDTMMKKVKLNLLNNLGDTNQAVLYREMEKAKQQVKFEVAW